MEDHGEDQPLFSAVSSTARQLYLLLRCISFASKAQVQISEEGLRFSVEEARVMEGLAFLDKSLFTSFQYNPSRSGDDDEDIPHPTFDISLPSLLETLQIFGVNDPSTASRPWSNEVTSFSDPRVLGMTGICNLSYPTLNSPLNITLSEPNITTTCELVTYETSFSEDIPFARDELRLKVIMRASWLYDAIQELASTNPETLTLIASSKAPFFSLEASGPLGSAVVAFQSKDKALLETFQIVGPRTEQDTSSSKKAPVIIKQSYRFALVRSAHRAMAVASKVSVRGDEQGVLSLQFMIEVEPGKVSFVDFRFVPMVEDEGMKDDNEEGEGTEEDETEEEEQASKDEDDDDD